MSNEVDFTHAGTTCDMASAKLLALGFTPRLSREAEAKALQSANAELQAQLRGYLVLRKCCILTYCNASTCLFSMYLQNAE